MLNVKCKMKSVAVMIGERGGGVGALSPIQAISIYFHSAALTEILNRLQFVKRKEIPDDKYEDMDETLIV